MFLLLSFLFCTHAYLFTSYCSFPLDTVLSASAAHLLGAKTSAWAISLYMGMAAGRRGGKGRRSFLCLLCSGKYHNMLRAQRIRWNAYRRFKSKHPSPHRRRMTSGIASAHSGLTYGACDITWPGGIMEKRRMWRRVSMTGARERRRMRAA